MSDLEVARDIYLFSVYSARDHGDIELAIEKGFIEFTENVEWGAVAELLDNVRQQEADLAVILADSTSEPLSIMAWGIVRKISVNGTQIRVRLEEVQAVPSRPIVEWSLLSHSTKENISKGDQRNHHIVITPKFLEYEPEPATFILTWNPKGQVPMKDFEATRADSFDGKPVHWEPAGSGIELKPEPVCEIVWRAWKERLIADGLLVKESPIDSNLSVEESVRASSESTESREDIASSIEGRLIESWSTRRERDPNNRARCLELHGRVCAVCDMCFLKDYGEIGRDFIHVHHERPLGASDDKTGNLQDPENAMKPVCPNCHPMLHRGMDARKGEVRSITDLRAIRARAKSLNLGNEGLII
jgi:hypothetical protein